LYFFQSVAAGPYLGAKTGEDSIGVNVFSSVVIWQAHEKTVIRGELFGIRNELFL
jgi:hypothetical protein